MAQRLHWQILGQVRVYELFGRGVARVRQERGWTQEQAANFFRSHGLRAWRKGTVGQLEAGLRRPRLDEMLLMARALGVTLDRLIPGGDEERVELGDDAVVSPRWIREMLAGDLWDQRALAVPYERFPLDGVLAEVRRRADAEEQRDAPLMEAIDKWAEQNDVELMAEDLFASHVRPSHTERHAAQRLGVQIAPLKYASRALWGDRNFDEERDRRVGDIDQLEPRSRQARRGLVTREMLAELRALFDEIQLRQARDGDDDR
jgi:transcriptional regulator with XRE-family HTH domain